MFKLKSKLCFLALVACSVNAFAADEDGAGNKKNGRGQVKEIKNLHGEVKFKGEITATSCVIEAGTQTVDMGTHSVNSLKVRGTTTEAKNFNIVIKDCPEGITSLTMLFAGTKFKANETLFKLDDASGNATNAQGIGLRIMQGDTQILPRGVAKPFTLTGNTGGAKLEYTAQYESAGALVTGGKADATITYIVAYN